MGKNPRRRSFLRASAGVAGASAIAGIRLLEPEPWVAAAQLTSASDRVRFGIVGVGMEGSNLLSNAVQLPGVECVAAADLYDARHELAREIAGKTIRTTRRYKELLDAKDIDAVIVAVPDDWHKQVVVDAIAAGKDVYCEKPSPTIPPTDWRWSPPRRSPIASCKSGAQRTSSSCVPRPRSYRPRRHRRHEPDRSHLWPQRSKRRLGVSHPRRHLPPENLDWDTWQGTAPKKAFDPYAFARWRCWKEYGTGVAGDLLVHLTSGMQFVLGINEIPNAYRPSAESIAGKTAVTCPTFIPLCMSTTASLSTCASRSGVSRLKSLVSRAPKAPSSCASSASLTFRRQGSTYPPVITRARSLPPCVTLM